MKHGMMLYLFDRTTRRDSTLAALWACGHEVVSTCSVTQAMALLFLMQSVAGVVLDDNARRTDADLIARLRRLCPSLPIVLLVDSPEGEAPEGVDACVCTAQSPETITSEVQRALTTTPDVRRRLPSQESAA